ncbi:MAG: tRNA (adenosine(37)-N6)-threonylcarbamoyltransferase complex ATPase subunit type 1 TsaE [Syntrophaceae bacterium]|nr:tRNA (adenosine(37)-N6)-threonylcarbamoyltransferase complex ATPase subunit type 1 TsaE [Syntrophaceae bacterium]
MFEIVTDSPEQTQRLGERLGEILSGGVLIALMGDLGAGKTLLTKGIAGGLGVDDPGEVTSPTFVLVNEYRGRVPVYHLDLYRLESFSEVEEIGWDEWIDGPGVTLVEWADKIEADLPGERLEVRLQWAGEKKRRLLFCGRGRKAERIIEELRSRWEKEE